MTTAVLLAVVAWIAFVVIAPRLSRRLPPAAATVGLTAGSVVIAGSGVVMIAMLAAPWIAQLPEISELGPWSATKLRSGSPVPLAAAVTFAALVGVAVVRLAVTGWRRARAMAAVRRYCRHLPATDASLVVVDSQRPDAFATPLPSGRIVVTTGLLRALSAAERRALLAHERAHLEHHHAWWVLAADLAASANPLLRPSARAVRRAVERWADEEAAAAVGDRALVARTIARVALLITSRERVPAMAASGGDVPDRVRALLAAPPRRRLLPVLGMVAMLMLTLTAGIRVDHRTDTVFDRATVPEAGYGLRHGHR
ncbi:M56 family metallopeptidase [Planosporangium mesophilum]|uniref:Peptidase M48 n=1 Tax=Planosporangium mesophilum TaxID=689768 RepID=A0A8J3TGR5_9ACTN|nr:M56 family metallopeptidase [Planosporangium mesophilum]NJC81945.1 M56 family metallopeptidase [Planosporangium mesophilum]GII25291.1 peptidase M48 [Planosporangium mesophilum]